MASLFEYYENDFAYALRVKANLDGFNDVQIRLIYDFAALSAFMSIYVSGDQKDFDFFRKLITSLDHGKTQFNFAGYVKLPSVKHFPGQLEVIKDPFDVKAKFHGETEWISMHSIKSSTRAFIYTESTFDDENLLTLKEIGREQNIVISFRTQLHAKERSKHETPIGFISHDSKDKEKIARPLATELNRMLCPVWYDEFSLKPGDSLRNSIESGLKSSKKCVLILSENFFANDGWAKKEYDSIFTRELIENQKVIVPVWHNVTKEEVFDYSPSLADTFAVIWEETNTEESIRKIHRALTS